MLTLIHIYSEITHLYKYKSPLKFEAEIAGWR